jgi:hypothetical protein
LFLLELADETTGSARASGNDGGSAASRFGLARVDDVRDHLQARHAGRAQLGGDRLADRRASRRRREGAPLQARGRGLM